MKMQTVVVKPFIQDARVYIVANQSTSGKQAGTNTSTFYFQKTLENWCCKACKKCTCIFNKKFKDREIVF
jgi:hypothetical protein